MPTWLKWTLGIVGGILVVGTIAIGIAAMVNDVSFAEQFRNIFVKVEETVPEIEDAVDTVASFMIKK